MQEIYTDIPEYEGLYQLGMESLSVKSVARKRYGNTKYFKKERILNPIKHNAGYSVFSLCKKGVIKRVFRHRIVASIFLGKCPKGMFVLHNDGNPENDHPSNLRYGTHQENMADTVRHGTHYSYTKGKLGGDNPFSKKVRQYSIEGEFIKEFPSAIEASKEIGGLSSSIRACASGVNRSSYGYKWKYS